MRRIKYVPITSSPLDLGHQEVTLLAQDQTPTMEENCTPGHSVNATAFMAARSFTTHGGFIEPYLKLGMNVLDCGCGPGRGGTA